MFATLVGTNTTSTAYEALFTSLYDIACVYGFEPPDIELRVKPN